MINQFIIILNVLPIAHGGNTHALLLFATTLSENSMTNVLKFRKLISLSESGSQKVRIRFTESGFGIRHYKSNQICSLLLVTDGYRSLQHVTDRYYSFLLLVITQFWCKFGAILVQLSGFFVLKYFNRRKFRERNFREFHEFWPFRESLSRESFQNGNSRKFIQWNFSETPIRESLSSETFI